MSFHSGSGTEVSDLLVTQFSLGGPLISILPISRLYLDEHAQSGFCHCKIIAF